MYDDNFFTQTSIYKTNFLLICVNYTKTVFTAEYTLHGGIMKLSIQQNRSSETVEFCPVIITKMQLIKNLNISYVIITLN
jgi:hypothetical protein